MKILPLLHAAQTFPAHIPPFGGETGIERLRTAVPSGAHHGHGIEKTAVAGKIQAQTFRFLEVVAADEICVLPLSGQKGVNRLFPLAEPGRAHGNHAVVPAPGRRPVPAVGHVSECPPHFRGVVVTHIREQSACPEHCRMIAVRFFHEILLRDTG